MIALKPLQSLKFVPDIRKMNSMKLRKKSKYDFSNICVTRLTNTLYENMIPKL